MSEYNNKTEKFIEGYVSGAADAVDELARFIDKPQKIIKTIKYLKEAALEAFTLEKKQREELVFTVGTIVPLVAGTIGAAVKIYNKEFKEAIDIFKYGSITSLGFAMGSIIFDRPFYEPIEKVIKRGKYYLERIKENYYTIRNIEEKVGKDIEGMLKHRRKNPESFKNMLVRSTKRTKKLIEFDIDSKLLEKIGRNSLKDVDEVMTHIAKKKKIYYACNGYNTPAINFLFFNHLGVFDDE